MALLDAQLQEIICASQAALRMQAERQGLSPLGCDAVLRRRLTHAAYSAAKPVDADGAAHKPRARRRKTAGCVRVCCAHPGHGKAPAGGQACRLMA